MGSKTTSLITDKYPHPDIIELVVLVVTVNTPNNYYESFVNPGWPVPADSTKYNNISNDIVASALPFEVIAEQFWTQFFSEANDMLVFIAYNGDHFDTLILQYSLKHIDIKSPNWCFTDSISLIKQIQPHLGSYCLKNLHTHAFDISIENTHRAHADVDALHNILLYYFNNIKNEEEVDVYKKIITTLYRL